MVQAPRTRDLVLREAARLFAERGFRGTSVVDIGTACGISGPAVYKHFPNKEALLCRLLVGISEQLVSGGRAVVADAPDARSALRALIDFHTDFALAEPDVIRVQDRDLASLNERDQGVVRRLQRCYVELWADVLCRLEPGLPREVGRLRAHAVFGLLNSTPHSARGRGEAARQLSGMALRALVPDVGPGAQLVPLSPEEPAERVAAAADADGRSPVPGMSGWEIIPFGPDGLRVVRLRPPELPRPPRAGAGGVGCGGCEPSSSTVWSDGHWTLSTLSDPSGAPLMLVLQPVAHVDLPTLPDVRASELGRLLVHVCRAVEAFPHVARAHVSR